MSLILTLRRQRISELQDSLGYTEKPCLIRTKHLGGRRRGPEWGRGGARREMRLIWGLPQRLLSAPGASRSHTVAAAIHVAGQQRPGCAERAPAL